MLSRAPKSKVPRVGGGGGGGGGIHTNDKCIMGDSPGILKPSNVRGGKCGRDLSDG